MRIKFILLAVLLMCGHSIAQQSQVIIRDPNNASQQAGVTNGALNVNVVSTSGSGGGGGTVTVGGTTAMTLSGTNITTSGTFTFSAGAVQQQFIFSSGTCILNGMTYTTGTQWNAPVVSRTYPATTIVVTGPSILINVQNWY